MINQYSTFSPYKDTPYTNSYLDIWVPRNFPFFDEDVMVELPSQYEHRPDLLANDAYGDSRLWWVFAVRNKDVIRDPVYDFIPGQTIFLPKLQTIKNAIGQ